MRARSLLTWLAAAALAIPAMLGAEAGFASARSRDDLIALLDGEAALRLSARHDTVLALSTREDADAHVGTIRQALAAHIGGLPDHPGHPRVRAFGEFAIQGVRLEKIAFESQPGFWVTADVYAPASGAGPFPAIVDTPGHYAQGKDEEFGWGVNFARHGIVALVYDPIGEGERLQYLDERGAASFIGDPVAEHGEAGMAPALLGEGLARDLVGDAMRAVDYLSARTDVDQARIGAFGCSGGGTVTTYLAALDRRIHAAASACYVTSFATLLPSPAGVQDSEQSLPRFIADGLDFGDWIEAAAPMPYAIVSTENDMFPFTGARATYEEARHVYDLYGASSRLRWITGPGAHGHLGPISNDILSFFTAALAAPPDPSPFVPIDPPSPSVTTVTRTGQVTTSLHSETVASLTRARATRVEAARASARSTGDVARLRERLERDIGALTGATRPADGDEPPAVRVLATIDRGTYHLDTIAFAGAGGLDVEGLLAVPNTGGRKAAVVLMDTRLAEALAGPGGPLDTIAGENTIAFAFSERPTTSGTEFQRSPYLGTFYLLSLRASLVGRTLIGLRIDDAIAAVRVLSARNDVGPIEVRGTGPHGLVALHAAVLDDRISSLVLENTLASYRMIVEQPAHLDASEIVVPGVLRRYDTSDLLIATHPRRVLVVSPRDAMGAPLAASVFRTEIAPALAADRALHTPNRITIVDSVRSAGPSSRAIGDGIVGTARQSSVPYGGPDLQVRPTGVAK